MAASHPLQNANQQAYIESFEGSGGINVNLSDALWYFASLPALGQRLPAADGGVLDSTHMATMAWQNNGTGADGKQVAYTITDIDPLAAIGGNGFAPPETILWMTLYPLSVGGAFNRARDAYQWHVGNTPSGARFRSIRTVLSPTGIDLTNAQYLQFWTLLDTTVAGRTANPTLVFDVGAISENSYTFAPETLYLRPRAGGGVDSVYAGKAAQGLDVLNTELDPFTHAFNVAVNDTGLPGDLIDTLVVVDENGGITKVKNFAVCQGQLNAILPLGDTHENCTVHNNRLDSEDIDQDGVLNMDSAHRESEAILRYVVDLSDPTTYSRVGNVALVPDTSGGVVTQVRKEWVLVKVPFNTPTDSLNAVLRRRMQALRITMVSGAGTPDNAFVQLPIDALELVGAPWLARNDQTITGIAGDQPAGGYVITSLIGTTDRDSVTGLYYVSPPGVTNAAASAAAAYAPTAVQINEQSLRIQAGNLPMYGRAEAYYRFPSGQQNFMGYQQLRLWARGRNHGWGTTGELQMYVKMGRDQDDFYMYRTPVNAGEGQGAWLPEVTVDFRQLFALRQQLQNAYMHRTGVPDSLACTGVDSALIVASGLPAAGVNHRYAACANGYMVYTVQPGVTPPNLAAVQEMAVGIVHVAAGGGATAVVPGDTLELWVDDIRLADVVSATGYASQMGATLQAGDLGTLRLDFTHVDPNFRQLGDQPSFQDQRTLELSGTLHMEKLLPTSWNVAAPLTVSRVLSTSAPEFLSGSDLLGGGIGGLRTPRDVMATYSVELRADKPVTGTVLAPIINHLSANATLTTGDLRDVYSTGSSQHLDFGLNYSLAPAGARTPLPDWMRRALHALPNVLQGGPVTALEQGAFRWQPTALQLSSGIVHNDDRQSSFLSPSTTGVDSASLSTGPRPPLAERRRHRVPARRRAHRAAGRDHAARSAAVRRHQSAGRPGDRRPAAAVRARRGHGAAADHAGLAPLRAARLRLAAAAVRPRHAVHDVPRPQHRIAAAAHRQRRPSRAAGARQRVAVHGRGRDPRPGAVRGRLFGRHAARQARDALVLADRRGLHAKPDHRARRRAQRRPPRPPARARRPGRLPVRGRRARLHRRVHRHVDGQRDGQPAVRRHRDQSLPPHQQPELGAAHRQHAGPGGRTHDELSRLQRALELAPPGRHDDGLGHRRERRHRLHAHRRRGLATARSEHHGARPEPGARGRVPRERERHLGVRGARARPRDTRSPSASIRCPAPTPGATRRT